MENSENFPLAAFAEQLCAKCQQAIQDVTEARHVSEQFSRARALLREFQEDPNMRLDAGLELAAQAVLSVARDINSAVDAATSSGASTAYWESDQRLLELLRLFDQRVQAATAAVTQYRNLHSLTNATTTPAEGSFQDDGSPTLNQGASSSSAVAAAADASLSESTLAAHQTSKPFDVMRAELLARAMREVSFQEDPDEPPDEYLCPITQQLMEDPVVLVDSGVSYERDAIEMWLARNLSCPITRQPIRIATLSPNRALKQLINIWTQLHPETPRRIRTPLPLPPPILPVLPPSVPGAICSLADLVAALRDAQENAVLDLGGRRLMGPCHELIISVAGITLRNGVLDLPPNVELRVQASGVRLEYINVHNSSSMLSPAATLIRIEPPAEGEVHNVTLEHCGAWSSASVTSGVLLEGCADVHMDKCHLRRVMLNGPGSQATLTDCEVHDGMVVGPMEAVALLERCSLFGNAVGLFVQGGRSSITARNTRVIETLKMGMQVVAGARAEVEDCELSGSKEANGLTVQDKGSTVVARRCKISSNKNSNVWVHRGGRLTLEDCELSNSKSRSGLQVQDDGSSVSAKGSKFVGNQVSGVCVMDKTGVVDLDGCELTGSKSDADLFVQGSASFLKARRCIIDSYTSKAADKK